MIFDQIQFEDDWSELRSLADLIRYGASAFSRADLTFAHGTDNAVDEAHVLVLHALGLDQFGPRGGPLPGELYHGRVTSNERAAVGELIRRRIEERCPAAYITGNAWFAGLKFFVDQRVLIPRSPLAEPIEARFAPWLEPQTIHRILDVGTGCGCIAIACAYAFPWAEVVAADIDEGALAVAALNVTGHRLDDRVQVIASDALAGVTGKFDLIVSNPPYVSPASVDALAAEFRHEPRLGLDGGEDGLEIVNRLIDQAGRYLSPHGALIVEVGESRPRAESAYATLEIEWMDDALERGGEGIFIARAEALV